MVSLEGIPDIKRAKADIAVLRRLSQRYALVQRVKFIQHFPYGISNLLFIGLCRIAVQKAILGKLFHITLANLDTDNKKAAKPPFSHAPRTFRRRSVTRDCCCFHLRFPFSVLLMGWAAQGVG